MSIKNQSLSSHPPMPLLPNQRSAEDVIARLEPHCLDEEIKAVETLVQVETEQAMLVAHEEERREYEAAKATKQLTVAEAQENQYRRDAAKQVFEQTRDKPRRLVMFMTAAICALACVAVDFDVCWSTLPFIISIPQHSVAGVLLAAGPTTVLAALELVVGILIYDPWEKARLNPALKKRITHGILMTAFLLTIGVCALYMVAKLNPARVEVFKAIANTTRMDDEIEQPVDMEKINHAINLVALTLSITGALFFAVARSEWRKLSAYWCPYFSFTILRLRQKRLDRRAAETTAQLAVKEQAWAQIKTRLQKFAEHYQTRLKILLHQSLKRATKQRSNYEIVNDI